MGVNWSKNIDQTLAAAKEQSARGIPGSRDVKVKSLFFFDGLPKVPPQM